MSLRRINRGRNHSYELDGQKVPGVTTLIGEGMPKKALPYWYARTVAEGVADIDDATLAGIRAAGRQATIDFFKGYPQRARDAAAVRGTRVHTLAEAYSKGERVEVPDELAGFVEAAVAFLDDWRIAPVVSEVSVASRRWQYAGTLDLIGDVPDGRRCLFDYKTSASGVWPETAMQLAAYRHAEFFVRSDVSEPIETPVAELGINASYAVWLRSDGSYEVLPLRTDEAVFATFLHVAHVAKIMPTMSDWVGKAERWTAPALT